MNMLLDTEDTRYSLKTLQALHYGATYGGCTAHGALRVTFTEGSWDIHSGSVLSIGPAGVSARDDDGTLRTDIKPGRILHAEVV